MSRINRTQKYAALWLYSQGWTVTKIASELELTDNQIKNAVKDSQRTTDGGIKTKSSVVSKNPNSKKLKPLLVNKYVLFIRVFLNVFHLIPVYLVPDRNLASWAENNSRYSLI